MGKRIFGWVLAAIGAIALVYAAIGLATPVFWPTGDVIYDTAPAIVQGVVGIVLLGAGLYVALRSPRTEPTDAS